MLNLVLRRGPVHRSATTIPARRSVSFGAWGSRQVLTKGRSGGMSFGLSLSALLLFSTLRSGSSAVAVQPAIETSSGLKRAAHWATPSRRCASFFKLPSQPARVVQPDSPLQIATKEDAMCGINRSRIHAVGHQAQEVVLVPSLLLAYVEVRKCASETITKALKQMGNASFHTCGHRSVPRNCAYRPQDRHGGLRCSTLCLTEEELQSYFFFSFVRHPLERFYSATSHILSVEFAQQGLNASALISRAHIQGKIPGRCAFNEHFESMSMSLSSPIATRGSSDSSELAPWQRPSGHRVRLDFIGSVENMETDFNMVLDIAASRKGLRLTQQDKDMLLAARTAAKSHEDHGSSHVSSFVGRLRDEVLDGLVENAYAQDIECFGFRYRAGLVPHDG